MKIPTTDDTILDIIKEHGQVTTKQIIEFATKKKVTVDKEYINSILYGYLREAVVRERNAYHVPTWRLKTQPFEAGKGYESTVYNQLITHNIVSPDTIFLDYQVRHPRSRKIYHLDIALFHNDKKFNIEVDGFDHMRADARLSIQEQITARGQKTAIDIDWMDNENSYVDFKKIDSTLVNKWCTSHLSWCIRYHEELIWPGDITRNIWLIDNGWRVMRLWNMEIKNNLKQCIQEIDKWINR